MTNVINATCEKTLFIGKRGENLATRVDFSQFYQMCKRLYGSGTIALIHERADEDAYPIALTLEGESVYWDVRSADVAIPGTGLAELTYVVDSVVKKSLRWKTVTLDSLGATIDPPPAWQSYVDAVIAAADRAENAATEIENMTVSSETLAPGSQATVEKTVGDVVNLKFGIPSGLKGDPGKDGFTPSASVVETSDGAKVSITDKNGTTIANVRNGKDGSSPIAKVEQIASGAKVTVTDKNGTTTAIIKDGKDGKDGDITTIVDFEMDKNGVLYYRTVSESTLEFNMYNGVLEVNYGR